MRQNMVSSLIVAFAVAIVAAEATVTYAAVPSRCSSSDKGLISTFTDEAVVALVGGDLQGYRELTLELEAKLSSACKASLAQSQPVRVKCTAKEKEVALSHVQAIMEAALRGDLNSLFGGLEDLEESVSSPCWKALNYPQDAGMQKACSSTELDLFASAAGPVIRGTERLLITGNLSEIIELMQNLNAKLSPDCRDAWAKYQYKTQQSPRGRTTGSLSPLGSVNDHGGGTYSVSGVGACTPSGCMAF